jgi:hypothetical protein
MQSYRGRVVDSPGDNILAEFRSVVDAVKCAVEIPVNKPKTKRTVWASPTGDSPSTTHLSDVSRINKRGPPESIPFSAVGDFAENIAPSLLTRNCDSDSSGSHRNGIGRPQVSPPQTAIRTTTGFFSIC